MEEIYSYVFVLQGTPSKFWISNPTPAVIFLLTISYIYSIEEKWSFTESGIFIITYPPFGYVFGILE